MSSHSLPSMCLCVLISFYKDQFILNHVQLFEILWTMALQAPLSMGISRQEYCGLLFPPLGNLLDPGIKPCVLYLLHCRWILYRWATGEAFYKDWASLVAQMVKNRRAMQETRVWSLGQEDPLEKGMVTHSSNWIWGEETTPQIGFEVRTPLLKLN